jgi:hypothetical protein
MITTTGHDLVSTEPFHSMPVGSPRTGWPVSYIGRHAQADAALTIH